MPRVRSENTPHFVVGNKFIITNYRPHLPFLQLLLSVFSLHNETFNVWSHLIGSMCMTALLVWFVWVPETTPCHVPKWPLIAYTTSTILCFTASWWAHLTGPLNKRYNAIVFKLDYLGIILTTMAHFLPVSFYMFVNESSTMRIMYVLVPSCMGLVLTTFATSNAFRRASWIPIRALCFAVYGSSTIVPLVHGVVKYWNDTCDLSRIGLSFLASDIVFNGLGALIYGRRYPERMYPQTFDMIGNSHNIMHVCAVGGLVSMFFCSYFFWEWAGTCQT